MDWNWKISLRDGTIQALAASGLLMGAIRFNPRLLLRHYPVELRESVAAMSRAERAIAHLIAIPLFGILICGPWFSTLVEGIIGCSYGVVFRHAFVVGIVFCVVDWLLLDELILGHFRPSWAMLPGTNSIPYRFDHAKHVRGFIFGSIFSACHAGIIAAVLSN